MKENPNDQEPQVTEQGGPKPLPPVIPDFPRLDEGYDENAALHDGWHRPPKREYDPRLGCYTHEGD